MALQPNLSATVEACCKRLLRRFPKAAPLPKNRLPSFFERLKRNSRLLNQNGDENFSLRYPLLGCNSAMLTGALRQASEAGLAAHWQVPQSRSESFRGGQEPKRL